MYRNSSRGEDCLVFSGATDLHIFDYLIDGCSQMRRRRPLEEWASPSWQFSHFRAVSLTWKLLQRQPRRPGSDPRSASPASHPRSVGAFARLSRPVRAPPRTTLSCGLQKTLAELREKIKGLKVANICYFLGEVDKIIWQNVQQFEPRAFKGLDFQGWYKTRN